jgi:hypothetical protein
MSGYDTTPNLGLLKPTYNGADDQWGNYLNQNADTLDLALGTSGAGALFLPLAGGTLTGSLTLPSITQNTNNQSLFGASPYTGQVQLFDSSNPGRLFLLNRNGSLSADDYLSKSYYLINDTGGTWDGVRFNTDIETVVNTSPVCGIWSLRTFIQSEQAGGNLGNNGSLGVAVQAVRPSATPIGNTTVSTTLGSPNAAVAVASLANFGTGYYSAGAPNPGTSFDLTNNPPINAATTSITASGTTIVNLPTAGLFFGMAVSGPNIPANTTIDLVNGATQIWLSQNTTASIASGTTLAFRYGMMVKVGATVYLQVAASAASGAGTLTFSSPVSVADATSGNAVLSQQGGAPLWSSYITATDLTGLPSSAGGQMLGMEMDLFGNGADDAAANNLRLGNTGNNATQGGRALIVAQISKQDSAGTDFQVGTGVLLLAGGSGVSLGSAYAVSLPFYHAGFDTRTATQQTGAHAIWLATNHSVAFDTGGAVQLSSNSASLALTGPGIAYAFASPNNHAMAFGWDGTSVLAYSDGGSAIPLASRAFVASAYLPLAGGGAVTGAISVATGSAPPLAITGAPPWSGFNLTCAMDIRTTGGNPALGISDNTGANYIGIYNNGGAFGIAAMGLPSAGASATIAGMLTVSRAGALAVVGSFGAWNTTPPAAKPTVTGAKGSNAALASLMTALAAYGLVTDSTTA